MKSENRKCARSKRVILRSLLAYKMMMMCSISGIYNSHAWCWFFFLVSHFIRCGGGPLLFDFKIYRVFPLDFTNKALRIMLWLFVQIRFPVYLYVAFFMLCPVVEENTCEFTKYSHTYTQTLAQILFQYS